MNLGEAKGGGWWVGERLSQSASQSARLEASRVGRSNIVRVEVTENLVSNQRVANHLLAEGQVAVHSHELLLGGLQAQSLSTTSFHGQCRVNAARFLPLWRAGAHGARLGRFVRLSGFLALHAACINSAYQREGMGDDDSRLEGTPETKRRMNTGARQLQGIVVERQRLSASLRSPPPRRLRLASWLNKIVFLTASRSPTGAGAPPILPAPTGSPSPPYRCCSPGA